MQSKKRRLNKEAVLGDLLGALIEGDRRALAQAITLVESSSIAHRAKAEKLLNTLLPTTGNSLRVGVTGLPGVGKSSLVEVIGLHAISLGHRVAVLAIDPSSKIRGGSILGDKTRMYELARSDRAFVRPSPARGVLGGVGRRTYESILLCEAAGYDIIFVETVGIGQSEAAIADITDIVLLMLLPGAGDELQGMKRGVLEMADIILINKADGDLKERAEETSANYKSALRLLESIKKQWVVPILTCSMRTGDGVSKVWELVQQYQGIIKHTGDITLRRETQNIAWMWTELGERLMETLKRNDEVRRALPTIETEVAEGRRAPVVAANDLLELFRGSE